MAQFQYSDLKGSMAKSVSHTLLVYPQSVKKCTSDTSCYSALPRWSLKDSSGVQSRSLALNEAPHSDRGEMTLAAAMPTANLILERYALPTSSSPAALGQWA